jgi:hypothetical protein
MKKVALISSFCDTQEKLNVLNKNIEIVKNLGIDVILISPIFLPESITSLCDYYFQTKDNLVLEWPIRSMVIWSELYFNDIKYKMSKTYGDYGWAGLSQVKKLSEIALLFEYDQYFHMIYDLKIDENVLEGFNSDRICNLYPSKRNENVWKVGLHFMVFDRKNLKRFISNIHIDSYLSLKGVDAFYWLENLHKTFPYNFETTPVEDEIFYYEGFDFFNYSPIQEQPFFIIKDDETLENIKLLFYSVNEELPINIKIDNYGVHDVITKNKIIDLGFNKLNPKNVKIFYKEKEFDITDIINKVKHNTFRLS